MNQYTCVCGRIFYNPQAFNGHKSHCHQHQINKYGNLDKYINDRKRINKKAAQTRSDINKLTKKQQLSEWVSEYHVCEHCGKVMTVYYGSGRFCSSECAHSRTQTEEINEKRSKTFIRKYIPQLTEIQIDNLATDRKLYKSNRKLYKSKPKRARAKPISKDIYEHNPKTCIICNKSLAWENRRYKYCSAECRKKSGNLGGIRKGSGTGHGGYYKGYRCDSTYELVYTIYNIDNNIPFSRCKLNYTYWFEGKLHHYYPDFELADGTLVEIKGFYSELVDIKLRSVTDRNIIILYKQDLQYAFDWVQNNYKYNKIEDLYDK